MTESSELTERQHLFVGQVFEGRFEILSVLGSGGVGVVYKAKHTHMDKVVAIKMLMTQVVSGDDSFLRFEQEARAASTLTHPNIITMHDFGKSVDRHAYLVMEYLDGVSLDDLLKTGGRLDLKQFLRIFTQLCDGLQHAHKKGIVHRDIKPSNIVLIDTEDESSVVKIVDFGLAKLIARDDAEKQHLTKTGTVMGTPLYMSPEQCRGAELDYRSDIYSVGCVMYAALTGQVPLKGDSTFDTMYRHMQETPAPFSVTAPDLKLPPLLERAVLKSLEKDAADRHQSMAELRDAITEAIAAGGNRIDDGARTVVSGANPGVNSGPSKAIPRSNTGSQPSMGSALPPERPLKRVSVILVTIGICVLVGVVVFAMQFNKQQERKNIPGINMIAEAPQNSKAGTLQGQAAPSAPLVAYNSPTDVFNPQASGGAASADKSVADDLDARTKRESEPASPTGGGYAAGGGGGAYAPAPQPVQKSRVQAPASTASGSPTPVSSLQNRIATDKDARAVPSDASSVLSKAKREAPHPVAAKVAPTPSAKKDSNRAELLARAADHQRKGNQNFNDKQWPVAIEMYERCLGYLKGAYGPSSPESVPVLARVVACSMYAPDPPRLKPSLDEAIATYKKNSRKVMAVVSQEEEPLRVWLPLARGSETIAAQSQDANKKTYFRCSADFYELALRHRMGPKNSSEAKQLVTDTCRALNQAGDHAEAFQVRKDFDQALWKELGQSAAQKHKETQEVFQERRQESAQKFGQLMQKIKEQKEERQAHRFDRRF